MTFDEIEKLVLDYRDIETKSNVLDKYGKKPSKDKQEEVRQQLIKIKYQLELPYKLLELIQEASNEDVVIEYGRKDEDFNVTFKNRKDRYNNYYLSLLSNQTELYEVVDFINSIKDKRLEEERKQQLKETALSKLTKEEKEVLGLS